MITITDEEYKLFQVWRSMDEVTCLEKDIDEPIRKVIALLALLGCKSAWSCCGFDYAGQPIHKSHQYGVCGIALLDTKRARKIVKFIEASDGLPFQNRNNAWKWSYYTLYGDDLIYIQSDIETKNTWPDKDCIHYSEPGVIAIGLLENFLIKFKDDFLESVIVKDHNAIYKKRYQNWQYQPKADWLIQKSDWC